MTRPRNALQRDVNSLFDLLAGGERQRRRQKEIIEGCDDDFIIVYNFFFEGRTDEFVHRPLSWSPDCDKIVKDSQNGVILRDILSGVYTCGALM